MQLADDDVGRLLNRVLETLGAVKREIGLLVYLSITELDVRRHAGDPETETGARHLVELADRVQVVEHLYRARGDHARIEIGENHRELVAAHAHQGAVTGEHADKRLADVLQQQVAVFVPADIVDNLEVVDVEQHELELVLLSATVFQVLLEAVIEIAPVPGAG